MHYIIIIVVISAIIYFQISTFIGTIRLVRQYGNIFANNRRDYKCLSEEPILISVVRNDNPILKDIISSINDYLFNNKGSVSDFHLMKDIVDRKCDAMEDKVDTQIPLPLYLGLMGTMFGILVGVGYLVFSGSLGTLMDAGSASLSKGIGALLGGVALAMISSIVGLALTTWGSWRWKEAKAEVEQNKHTFLCWIQARLLPNLNNNTAQELERMSQNLVAFNTEFSNSTNKLGQALAQVNETTILQKDLLAAVQKIADKNITQKNLELYNVLRNSSGELGQLAEYLHETTEYLTLVKELNEKLDKDDRRSKAIEKMLEFFVNETTQIEQRKAVVSKSVGEIDNQLESQLRKLGENASANIESFNKRLGQQQDALERKLGETQLIVAEIKNLASIKESASKFEKAINEQNRKIDALTSAINRLINTKVTEKEPHHSQTNQQFSFFKNNNKKKELPNEQNKKESSKKRMRLGERIKKTLDKGRYLGLGTTPQ